MLALAGADGGPGGGRGASASGAGRASSGGGGGERRAIKFSNPPSWPKALMLSTWTRVETRKGWEGMGWGGTRR